jgi:hypothetical protein
VFPRLARCFPQIIIADYIVAIKHTAGFVATYHHRYPFRDTGASHVSNRSAPEVVKDLAGETGFL